MVGAKRYDVISLADFLVQVSEEFAEVSVETHQDVLDFAAARAKCVPNIIHRGVADTEIIRGAAFA